MKYVYKLSQDLDISTGTYDSMVVIADSENEAIFLKQQNKNFLF